MVGYNVCVAQTTNREGKAGMPKILVVDDEKFIITAIKRTLREDEIEGALNGTEALERFKAGETFDLIITDCDMPVMGGVELVEELRQRGVTTPILMNSAKDQPGAKRLLRDGHIQGFFSKPWTMEHLRGLVVSTLAGTSQQ